MTDVAAAGEVEDGAPVGRKRLSGKKLVLFFILPTLLAIGGGAAAYIFLYGPAAGGKQPVEAPTNIAFYDLPEMLVNLNTDDGRQSYLKIRVALELEDAANIPALEAVLPRIVDDFQVFLRELRVEDLNGSAGMVRLKEELLYRVNKASDRVEINDVLFREMLVQ